MIPLIYANVGETNIIKRLSGSNQIKSHLEDIGFVVGTTVSVVSSIDGNLIVKVKDSRVALDKELASKIMI